MNTLISKWKWALAVGGLKIVALIIIAIFLVTLLMSIVGNVTSLFASEKEVKATPPEDIFPSEFYSYYKEASEAYHVPWSIIAAIHYVQTEFMERAGWFSKYKDAFDLPDTFWDTWQTSREDYYQQKRIEEELEQLEAELAAAEEEEEIEDIIAQMEVVRNSYRPIAPNRQEVGDVVFTVAYFFSFINLTSAPDVDRSIMQITLDQKKTERGKFYHWLFNNFAMGGPGGWPVGEQYGSAYITSLWGWRSDPFTGKRDFHSGVDIAPPQGEPVYAIATGKVMYAGPATGYGTLIIIEHEDFELDSGSKVNIRSYYAHSQNLMVTAGVEVLEGQQIAEIGNEGRSTGPHLHFEVYIQIPIIGTWENVDPMNFITPPDLRED